MAGVWYETGNEHNPTDPFGRVTLELDAGGAVRLAHHSRSGYQAWTARVEPGFLDRLADALRTAGFPAAPRTMPPPGDRLRDLRVTGGPDGAVLLPSYEAAKLPGYDEAFALLDGLVAQITGLTLPVPPLKPPATDIRPAD